MRLIRFKPTFEGWQQEARMALAQRIAPAEIEWQELTTDQPALGFFDTEPLPSPTKSSTVPKQFMASAKLVALHSDPGKWHLLYRVLWRLTQGEPNLLKNPVDADVLAFAHLEKEVSKDAYRMTAFLRFREVKVDDASWYVAWYEPEHDTVHLNADFFVNRFATMRWSILTPQRCMHWNGEELTFSNGVDKSAAPDHDDMEKLWVTYYSTIFNPARLKVRAMQAQLLKRNWKNLPEAAVIEPLIRDAPRRVNAMIDQSEWHRQRDDDFSPAPVPSGADWSGLRDAASTCRACPLWKQATCTVFGEGSSIARVVLVGEQPGDQEDRTGKPFVGPAGQILDRALAASQIDRQLIYVTNAVKHFKFEPRGKRRIHKTANAREVAACRPWLKAELDLIQPALVVALGATASQSLFDRPIKVLTERGQILNNAFGQKTLVTVHPSSLLRLPAGVEFEPEFARFVSDLQTIRPFLS